MRQLFRPVQRCPDDSYNALVSTHLRPCACWSCHGHAMHMYHAENLQRCAPEAACFTLLAHFMLCSSRSGKTSDATTRKFSVTDECQPVATHACQHDGWQQGMFGETCCQVCKHNHLLSRCTHTFSYLTHPKHSSHYHVLCLLAGCELRMHKPCQVR